MKFCRGDQNYVRYLQLKSAANQIAVKVLSCGGETARNQKDVLRYLDIEKKAQQYKEKSQIYYKTALSRYDSFLSRETAGKQTDLASGKDITSKTLSKPERDHLLEKFAAEHIPFASINISEITGAPAAEIQPPEPGLEKGNPEMGKEPESPGSDISTDFEDGGPHGHGISLDM